MSSLHQREQLLMWTARTPFLALSLGGYAALAVVYPSMYHNIIGATERFDLIAYPSVVIMIS
jgi:hypothetical protein